MLKTEQRNENTRHIDTMSTMEMLTAIQRENERAAKSVGEAIENIAAAVDEIAARMKSGGRLFYAGCGTSGRLGVLDASEIPPTYGAEKTLVTGIIAGGDRALKEAIENAEDDEQSGKADLARYAITSADSVIGISAAGGAAYVAGALKYANEKGAYTVALTCNENTPIGKIARAEIITDTGAEAITGSTRMKAGTAHKLVLNMISTSVMVKLGYVKENLMINLRPTNAKLKRRMISIVAELAGVSSARAETLLEENGWQIQPALAAAGK